MKEIKLKNFILFCKLMLKERQLNVELNQVH